MGYRSEVYLKTTTEGWILMKKFNDSIATPEDKPLYGAKVEQTSDGFYRISFSWVKWDDTYKSVQNFNEMMTQVSHKDIPFHFIRIGENYDDIEQYGCYPDDTPDEIYSVCTRVEIEDDNEDDYEEISC